VSRLAKIMENVPSVPRFGPQVCSLEKFPETAAHESSDIITLLERCYIFILDITILVSHHLFYENHTFIG
jgi:hypothetical protein